jgi:hypothetical protein
LEKGPAHFSQALFPEWIPAYRRCFDVLLQKQAEKIMKFKGNDLSEHGMIRLCLFTACLFLVFNLPVFADEYSGNCFVTFGKSIASTEFSDALHVDELETLGISFDVTGQNWPAHVLFESSYMYGSGHIAASNGTLNETQLIQVIRSDTCLGLKRILHLSSVVKPNVFAGACLVNIFSEKGGHWNSDTALGYFFGAGVFFNLTEQFSLGCQWKQTRIHISLDNKHIDERGDTVTALAGISF